MMMMMHKAKYVTICLSVLFSASRTTFLMFIGTNDSELKNVAGLAQRFVGPNDSELKNVAGFVRRGSLKVVIQVGRCPVVQNRTSKASCVPTDAYNCAIFSFEAPMP